MDLSPEERRKIYEEEKSRIESEQKNQPQQQVAPADSTLKESTVNMEPHVAALLCYVGFWISGIVFLVIEQKNKFIRYHAIQSIIVFGFLNLCASILMPIPFAGPIFGLIILTIALVFWIVLMIFAYRGELYRVPLAGDVAARFSGATASDISRPSVSGTRDSEPEVKEEKQIQGQQAAVAPQINEGTKSTKGADSFGKSRAGRLTGDAFAIAWDVVLLIFFNFYNSYIKVYEFQQANNWVSYPILTSSFVSWLVILDVALFISIAAHIILIVFDKYILREAIHLVLNVIGIVVVGSLLLIYPFTFANIPDTVLAAALPVGIASACGLVLLILMITTVVRLVKLIVNAARRTPEY